MARYVINADYPDGWKGLVEPLLGRCVAEGVQVTQVKEKFGGLRLYTAGGESPELAAAIADAEKASFSVCQDCGAAGSLRQPREGGHWVRTLCDEHAAARGQQAGGAAKQPAAFPAGP